MFLYDKEGDTLRAGYVPHVRTVDRFRMVLEGEKVENLGDLGWESGFHEGNFGLKSVLGSSVMGNVRGGGVSNLIF